METIPAVRAPKTISSPSSSAASFNVLKLASRQSGQRAVIEEEEEEVEAAAAAAVEEESS